MKLVSQRGIWAWKMTVAVQRPQRQEVDVEPDRASPVGGIMLCVIRSMYVAAFTQRPTVPTYYIDSMFAVVLLLYQAYAASCFEPYAYCGCCLELCSTAMLCDCLDSDCLTQLYQQWPGNPHTYHRHIYKMCVYKMCVYIHM